MERNEKMPKVLDGNRVWENGRFLEKPKEMTDNTTTTPANIPGNITDATKNNQFLLPLTTTTTNNDTSVKNNYNESRLLPGNNEQSRHLPLPTRAGDLGGEDNFEGSIEWLVTLSSNIPSASQMGGPVQLACMILSICIDPQHRQCDTATSSREEATNETIAREIRIQNALTELLGHDDLTFIMIAQIIPFLKTMEDTHMTVAQILDWADEEVSDHEFGFEDADDEISMLTEDQSQMISSVSGVIPALNPFENSSSIAEEEMQSTKRRNTILLEVHHADVD